MLLVPWNDKFLQLLDQNDYEIRFQNQQKTCSGRKGPATPTVTYLSECRKLCDDTNACNFFVYNTDAKCHLYASCIEPYIEDGVDGTLFEKITPGNEKSLSIIAY